MKNAVLCVALLIFICCCAYGQRYSVLHTFQGYPADGEQPVDSLVSDGAGNLYGTTKFGGANGVGTVFGLTPNGDGSWSESVL